MREKRFFLSFYYNSKPRNINNLIFKVFELATFQLNSQYHWKPQTIKFLFYTKTSVAHPIAHSDFFLFVLIFRYKYKFSGNTHKIKTKRLLIDLMSFLNNNGEEKKKNKQTKNETRSINFVLWLWKKNSFRFFVGIIRRIKWNMIN